MTSAAAAMPPAPPPRAEEGMRMEWVFQGEFRVSRDTNLCYTTVLGSCVAVCMRDATAGIGGMNHFLLPEATLDREADIGLSMRYGSYSVERLVNAIVSRGGRRDRLELKVFGGADIGSFASFVGSRNVDFIERYATREGLRIFSSDLGGAVPRKLRYVPTTGRAFVAEVREIEVMDELRSESEMAKRIAATVSTPAIEIF
jgi:chemotaxis protein CheD